MFGGTGYNKGRVRGGADQFSWEEVKSDKFRENYLGNSLMAPVGRWAKGKDLSWYSRGKRVLSTEQARREELDAVKREEEQAMMAALGMAPAPSFMQDQRGASNLDKAERAKLLGKDEEATGANALRMQGLGAAAVRTHQGPHGGKSGGGAAGMDGFEARGERLEGAGEEEGAAGAARGTHSRSTSRDRAQQGAGEGSDGPAARPRSWSRSNSEGGRHRGHRSRHEGRKKHRKEKKEKKEKKHRKEKKRHRRSRSRGRGGREGRSSRGRLDSRSRSPDRRSRGRDRDRGSREDRGRSGSGRRR